MSELDPKGAELPQIRHSAIGRINYSPSTVEKLLLVGIPLLALEAGFALVQSQGVDVYGTLGNKRFAFEALLVGWHLASH